MSSVFISYIRENRETIDKLYEALTSYGIDVWIDWRSLEPGDLWEHKIRQAIREGAFFIPCFSKEYNDRDESYMEEELNVAIKVLQQKSLDKKWFIPVKLNECEIPDYDIGRGETLRSFQYVDLSEDWDTGIQKLLESMSPGTSEAEKHFRTGNTKGKQQDYASAISFQSTQAQGKQQASSDTIPQILLSADLKPGIYRIKPTIQTSSNHRLKNVGIYINGKDMVRILLNPEPWVSNPDGGHVINIGDEIVVEIIQKKQEVHEVQGRIRRRVFEYEGEAIENLSNPENLFEYEITDIT